MNNTLISPGNPYSQSANSRPGNAPALVPDVQRASVGLVMPRGNMSLAFKVQIDKQGNIYQPVLDGFQRIGQVDPYGNYQFQNGLSGNCFRDGQFEIVVDKAENPFQQSLVRTKQQRASSNSIIPMIRQDLTSKGIDGKGITVADLEPFDEDKDKKLLMVSPHTQSVAAVIQDPYWGVAPGAKVKNFGWYSPDYELKSDDIGEFNQLLAVQQLYKEMNSQLKRVAVEHQKDPSLRVVNISWGLSPIELYVETLSVLQSEDEKTGHYKFPKIRQMVLGETAQQPPEAQFNRVMNYVNQLMINNPVIPKLHQEFVGLSKQLADNGITILASAANSHDQMPYYATVPPGHEMCVWALSPYVISVAASDTNLTPNDTSDDLIAPFSSRGDGKLWNPTIAAPGSEIGLSQQYGPIGQSLVTKGTSYSSPITAGTVAMMLQQNPKLTYAQIRDTLIKTATDTDNPYSDEGYGMLNPIQAVKQAQQVKV